MTGQWLDWAEKVDLSGSRGNGPFHDGNFRGVALHVNASGIGNDGTPVGFFESSGASNPNLVTPTFQVFRSGRTVQFLPLDWQPWCQIVGNFQYGAIETGGDPSEPLNDAQLAACGRIVRAYHDVMGMPYAIADQPGKPGIGTHQMGGAAWGGHACPGSVRQAQRQHILELARGGSISPNKPSTPITLEGDDMARIVQNSKGGKRYYITGTAPALYVAKDRADNIRAVLGQTSTPQVTTAELDSYNRAVHALKGAK